MVRAHSGPPNRFTVGFEDLTWVGSSNLVVKDQSCTLKTEQCIKVTKQGNREVFRIEIDLRESINLIVEQLL